MAKYAVSKTFKFSGGVHHLYQSAESSLDANTGDSTDYGTEFNTGFEWNIYLEAQSFSDSICAVILATGDYGIAADATPDDDDLDGDVRSAGPLLLGLDHIF